MQAGAIGETGGGQPVNNMQPYLGLNWCIDLIGTQYPPP
jgi:microcystin-dependent protein